MDASACGRKFRHRGPEPGFRRGAHRRGADRAIVTGNDLVGSTIANSVCATWSSRTSREWEGQGREGGREGVREHSPLWNPQRRRRYVWSYTRDAVYDPTSTVLIEVKSKENQPTSTLNHTMTQQRDATTHPPKKLKTSSWIKNENRAAHRALISTIPYGTR